MENQHKVSIAPMILGIIGGVLGLPAAICAGACAAGASSLSDTATDESVATAAGIFFWLAIVGALLGLISSFLYKKNTMLWGIIMVVGGVMCGLTLNLLSILVALLLIIGGIISMVQKKPAMI